MSHFTALLLYAFFASIVIGITQRSSTRGMVQFGSLCFGGFVAAAIVVSWGMWFIKH
jgi:uncharacterized protein (DUF697 family)